MMFIALGVGAAGAQAASFTITKQTDPAGDPTPFAFDVSFKPHPGDKPPSDFKPPTGFTLAGGKSVTFTVHKGFYTVRELTPAGWKLVNITCDNGNDPDPADRAKIDLGAQSATIELSRTEKKACTFRNQKVVTPAAPTPSSPPAAAPVTTSPGSPAGPEQVPATQQVAGQQAVRAAARLSAPKRCVSRRYTVSVTAGRVQSVAFFVNGQRVRTLSARPGQRRFSVRLPRPAPVSRVIARVRYRSNTTPATRTLRTTIRRCAQQAVRPQFTG
jgi:hypothetical protein